MKERDYKSALDIMIKIVDMNISSGYNAYLAFSLYKDIENCYKELYDYENAYRYSTKRLSLIESFKS